MGCFCLFPTTQRGGSWPYVGVYNPFTHLPPTFLSPSSHLPFTRCCDDRAVFELDDNTVIHYFFAAENVNKSIDIALSQFGTSPEDYDFAVFNAGNIPAMPADEALASAQRIHEAKGSFVWLATYDGKGDVRSWSPEQQQAFLATDAKFIAVNSMMESVVDFTRGAVEGISDSHFCLPGPPDELGLLLRQVIWALSFERRR